MRKILCLAIALLLISGCFAIADTYPTIEVAESVFVDRLTSYISGSQYVESADQESKRIDETLVLYPTNNTKMEMRIQDGVIQHARIYGGAKGDNTFEAIVVFAYSLMAAKNDLSFDDAIGIVVHTIKDGQRTIDNIRCKYGNWGNGGFEFMISPEALFNK